MGSKFKIYMLYLTLKPVLEDKNKIIFVKMLCTVEPRETILN